MDRDAVVVSILDLDAVNASPGLEMPTLGDQRVRRRETHYSMLRRLLHDIDPSCTGQTIQRSRFGKPYLRGGPHFSLSRSGRWGAIAISREFSVGIDIEMARSLNLTCEAIEQVKQRLAAVAGPAAVVSDPLEDWTRLEAAVKCRGESLSTTFSQELKSGQHASSAALAIPLMQIESITEPLIYVAALAVLSSGIHIDRRDFNGAYRRI